MIRHCDGTDDNLTQEILATDYNSATMTLSGNWDRMAREGRRVIRCQCGLTFDDVDRLVTYPHDLIGMPAHHPYTGPAKSAARHGADPPVNDSMRALLSEGYGVMWIGDRATGQWHYLGTTGGPGQPPEEP
jgi:hypothetical protein